MYHFLLVFSIKKNRNQDNFFSNEFIYLSPLIDCSSKSWEKLLEVSADVNSRVFRKLSKNSTARIPCAVAAVYDRLCAVFLIMFFRSYSSFPALISAL